MAVSPDEPTPNERTPREPTPIDAARRSRLDREVNEILAKAQREHPLPPTPIASRRPQQSVAPIPTDQVSKTLGTVMDTLLAVPLLTALGLGIACAVIAPSSRLIATLFAVLALIMVVLPYIQAARRSSQPGSSPKMWRGQVMDAPRRPGIGQETPADKISQWINNRRR